MKTTLLSIRSCAPCKDSWAKLLAHFGKTEADETEVRIVEILDLLGVDDALWALRAVDGHDREKRLLAVTFARRVQHLMTDQRSLAALDVAERFANGEATEEELEEARAAAWAAAGADGAAGQSAWAAGQSAWAAAWAASWAADGGTDGGTAWEAAWKAAWKTEAARAAREAERSWQAEELRRVCLAIEAGENPYPKKEAVK